MAWYGDSERHRLARLKALESRTQITETKIEKKLKPSKKVIDFELPIEQKIYVPSTYDFNKKISRHQFITRIHETEKFLSKLFGGYTEVQGMGGYFDEDMNRFVEEEVAVVVSYASRKGFKKKQRKLIQWLLKKCTEWKQDSMGYEVEGNLYYIKP